MAREKIRITTDLDKLIPGENLTIGDQVIVIRPLGLRKIKEITSKVSALFKILSEKGVTFSESNEVPANFKTPENLLLIAETLVTQFPEVLEEVSGIDKEDLEELPVDIIVDILSVCLEVNLKSKESLLGNWQSLTGKLISLGLLEKKPVVKEKTQAK